MPITIDDCMDEHGPCGPLKEKDPNKKSAVIPADLSELFEEDNSRENVLAFFDNCTRGYLLIDPEDLKQLLTLRVDDGRDSSGHSLSTRPKYDFSMAQLSQLGSYLNRGKRKMKEAGHVEGVKAYSSCESHVSRAMWLKKNEERLYGGNF